MSVHGAMIGENSPHCQHRGSAQNVEISPNDAWLAQPDNPGMPYDPQLISKNIQKLADELGSQRKLAKKAKLDPKTIGNAINKTTGMTLKTACIIADCVGITVAELIGEPQRIDLETRALAKRVLDLAGQAEDKAEAVLLNGRNQSAQKTHAEKRRGAKSPR